MPAMQPTEVRRNKDGTLFVRWSDGMAHSIPPEQLRRNCPCAVCSEKRGDTSHAKPLTGRRSLTVLSASSDEETKLMKIWAVGGYAIGMQWQDQHDSGIYTYRLLRELGEKAAGASAATSTATT